MPASKRTNKLATSGSEVVFSENVYGSPLAIGDNNCWAYAIDHLRNSSRPPKGRKLQPGELSIAGNSDVNLSSCQDLRNKVMRDLGDDAYEEPSDRPCRKGYYKIFSVISPNQDFHFYKHHRHVMYRVKRRRTLKELAGEFDVDVSEIVAPNGPKSGIVKAGDVVMIRNANVFSHKQGFSRDGPILRDSCGKIIKDPRKACRAYGSLDYSQVCGSHCVRNKVR
jgi:hypothetical protein